MAQRPGAGLPAFACRINASAGWIRAPVKPCLDFGRKMLILATDLDRTLFPNGLQEDDKSLPRLRHFLHGRPDIMLVYVTGRNAVETVAGIREYAAPFPVYAVCEVGTRIYRVSGGRFHVESAWDEKLGAGAPAWNRTHLRRALSRCAGLRLQPRAHQNPFKLSYFLDKPQPSDMRVRTARALIRKTCPDASAVYSIDETLGKPSCWIFCRVPAGKLAGLDHVRAIYGLALDDLIYAGDSGNDLLPLTCRCRAILIRNARDDVRAAVQQALAAKGPGGSAVLPAARLA